MEIEVNILINLRNERIKTYRVKLYRVKFAVKTL
jgi:hypothetical protein